MVHHVSSIFLKTSLKSLFGAWGGWGASGTKVLVLFIQRRWRPWMSSPSLRLRWSTLLLPLLAGVAPNCFCVCLCFSLFFDLVCLAWMFGIAVVVWFFAADAWPLAHLSLLLRECFCRVSLGGCLAAIVATSSRMFCRVVFGGYFAAVVATSSQMLCRHTGCLGGCFAAVVVSSRWKLCHCGFISLAGGLLCRYP